MVTYLNCRIPSRALPSRAPPTKKSRRQRGVVMSFTI